MKKLCVGRTIIIILAIVLFATLISSACSLLKLTFEDIVMCSRIDEKTGKPLDEKTEFEASAENIFATIHFDNVKGDDNYRFKWTNLDTGKIVLDDGNKYNMDKKGKFITDIINSKISSKDFPSKVIPSGNYKVDYYHNGEVVKMATFKVKAVTTETTKAAAAAGVLATFNDSNTFTEAQSKYFFTMQYPDNWEYKKSEEAGILKVLFAPLNKDETYYLVMDVSDAAEVKESDYLVAAEGAAKNYVQSFGGDMQQVGDTVITDGTLSDGTPFKSYVCYFIDNSSANKDEYAVITDIILKFNKLYGWTGIAPKIYYNQLDAAYLGALKTLVLKK